MTKYAHVKDGAVYRIKDLTAEQIADIPAEKATYILPYIEVARPLFDTATHHPSVRQPDAISASNVTQVWTAPVAKTAGELDDEKTSKATNIARRNEIRLVKLILTGQFFLINEIRALQSKVPINIDQYFSALDALPTISDAKFIERIKALL